jgi:putative glutamine amidotransferase
MLMTMNETMNSPGDSDLPVIGIPAQTCQAKWVVWEREASLVPQILVDRVAAAGGMPVLLPSLPGIRSAVKHLDGLVMPGGPDVGPDRYGAPRHERTLAADPRQDAADFALLEAALARRLPVFGICRGMQLLNVHLGGSLHQYIPELTGNSDHAPGPGVFGPQQVRVEAGSQLAKIMGEEIPPVPCYHRQAIDRLGEGLTTTAWSKDGIIEAVELSGYPFAIGVQWHGDEDGYDQIFKALVDAARQ